MAGNCCIHRISGSGKKKKLSEKRERGKGKAHIRRLDEDFMT